MRDTPNVKARKSDGQGVMTILFVAVLMLIAPYGASFAQENIKTLAAEYVEIRGLREALNGGIETSVDMLVNQFPDADKIKTREILYQALGWERLGGQITDLIASTYTSDELKALIAFYKTPAGKAAVLKNSHFSAEYNKLYSSAFQAAMGKLEEVLEPSEEETNLLQEGDEIHWTEYKKIDSDDCVSIPFVGTTCHTVTYKFEFKGRVSRVDRQAQEYLVSVTNGKVVPQAMVSPMYFVYKERAQSWANQQTARVIEFKDME